MAKDRVALDLPDISGFQPRTRPPETDRGEIERAAESAGFQTRHAPKKLVTAPEPTRSTFDARSLRRTNKTAKLNIATTEENRERFWQLAQEMGLTSGDDVLCALMDAYTNTQKK